MKVPMKGKTCHCLKYLPHLVLNLQFLPLPSTLYKAASYEITYIKNIPQNLLTQTTGPIMSLPSNPSDNVQTTSGPNLCSLFLFPTTYEGPQNQMSIGDGQVTQISVNRSFAYCNTQKYFTFIKRCASSQFSQNSRHLQSNLHFPKLMHGAKVCISTNCG